LIRVLAPLPYPLGRVPGQRFRIEQWAPLLRDHDIEVEFSAFLAPEALDVLHGAHHFWAKVQATLAGHLGRMRDLGRLDQYDLVFVFREAALLGPPWFERRAAHRVPLVFDFDDAIYLPAASRANAWVLALKAGGKTDELCRLARHVTVGNEHLAGYARGVSQAVTVIPTTIDLDSYTLASRGPNPRPVVGWSGSTTTVEYLQSLREPLARLRQESDFELRVIGGQVRLEGVDPRCMPWRAESEVEDLRALDVGLMPLADDEWSRGKCGLKALQYMALGIPPVVSPVGVNATIVQDGVNGFHARSATEWVDRIGRLLRDPDLRARLGAAARRTVEAGYSARVQAPRLAAVLREAAARA
jgi:glycosyltransferase involved in cell wall biosynthesis